MSHCAPAARKPIRFKFTPETHVGDVLVAQVCWEAVPDTWPGNSKTPVTECVVECVACARNSTRSEWTQNTCKIEGYVEVWVRTSYGGGILLDSPANHFFLAVSTVQKPVPNNRQLYHGNRL